MLALCFSFSNFGWIRDNNTGKSLSSSLREKSGDAGKVVVVFKEKEGSSIALMLVWKKGAGGS
jgi:hypothetical protein